MSIKEMLAKINHIHFPGRNDIYVTIITHDFEQTLKVKLNEPFAIIDGRIITLTVKEAQNG